MGSPRTNVKEREKKERRGRRAKKRKRIEAQGKKPPTPTWVTDALIGEEEGNGKKDKKLFIVTIIIPAIPVKEKNHYEEVWSIGVDPYKRGDEAEKDQTKQIRTSKEGLATSQMMKESER